MRLYCILIFNTVHIITYLQRHALADYNTSIHLELPLETADSTLVLARDSFGSFGQVFHALWKIH